jgi:hypothetical protein
LGFADLRERRKVDRCYVDAEFFQATQVMPYFLAAFSLLEEFVGGFGVRNSLLQDLPDHSQ